MSNDPLKKALREFAQKLKSSQKDLESDFQKILNDNLWDLYVESDGDTLEFTHEGIKYKVTKNFDDEREECYYEIHRKVPGDSWIYWMTFNGCCSLKEAKEKFIEYENNS